MSKEQQNQVQEQVANTEEASTDAPEEVPAEKDPMDVQEEVPAGKASRSGKKRSKRKTKLVNAEEVIPRPSFWPILLAASIAVMLVGVLVHVAIFILGIVLMVGTLVGWIWERR